MAYCASSSTSVNPTNSVHTIEGQLSIKTQHRTQIIDFFFVRHLTNHLIRQVTYWREDNASRLKMGRNTKVMRSFSLPYQKGRSTFFTLKWSRCVTCKYQLSDVWPLPHVQCRRRRYKTQRTRNQIDHVYQMSLTVVTLEGAVYFICLTVRKSEFTDDAANLSNGTRLSQHKKNCLLIEIQRFC